MPEADMEAGMLMRRRVAGQSVGRMLVCLVGMGFMMAGVAARAGESAGVQRSTGSTPAAPAAANPSFGIEHDPSDPTYARMQEKQIASAATDRHKRMVADADKLLELATELKQDVDGTTKDEMSVPTIKKAAEIEKLAHDVKERMKGQ
jgi:hypothetical protein